MISGGIFDLDLREKEIAELQVKTQASDFWEDNVAAQKVMQQISERAEWVAAWNNLARTVEDADSLVDLAVESADESLTAEIDQELSSIEEEMGDLEFRNMLSGEDDD